MRLLSTKQTLLFARNNGDLRQQGGGDNVTVSPKPGIQEVPDWLRETTTFEEAAKAGVIVDLDNLGRAPVAAPVVEQPTVADDVGITTKKSKPRAA